MKRRLFHVYYKTTNKHNYYGSLVAVFTANKYLGVSKGTLDRYDFIVPFENEICIIRKDISYSASDLKKSEKK